MHWHSNKLTKEAECVSSAAFAVVYTNNQYPHYDFSNTTAQYSQIMLIGALYPLVFLS